MLFTNSIWALLAIAGVASANKVECYTAMGDKRVQRVPTKYTTHYTPCAKLQTATKTVTKTPTVTVTKTKVDDKTVQDPRKKTSTTTLFKPTTIDFTVTQTTTSTSTVIIRAFTESVVPAPAMFSPIQSSLPGSTFTNLTAPAPPVEVIPPVKRSVDTLNKRMYGKYAKSVICHKYAPSKQCVVKKVTVVKTVNAPAKTITQWATVTRTRTLCPTATTTKTRTIVTTIKNTVLSVKTESTTTTDVQIVGTSTIYAACLQTANYANRIRGLPIAPDNNPQPFGREPLLAVAVAENAYQCCNLAMRSQGNFGDLIAAPELFTFDLLIDDRDGIPSDTGRRCQIQGSFTCAAKQEDSSYEIFVDPVLTADDPADITVGNLQCGLGVPAPEV